MLIGERLRLLRENKELSQGDVERRTGLLRCYISRVENEHTVPSLETLEKLARALEIPLYQFFYEGGTPPEVPASFHRNGDSSAEWGSSGKDARFLQKLRHYLGRMDAERQGILLAVAQKTALRRKEH
jgi:transcriptional regulator with XRE-family HTH domain